MRSCLILFLLIRICTLPGISQPVIVFTKGEGGYQSFRIPAIISVSGKSLLAFCEGRRSGPGDFGDIDIVMKKSTDNGRTWSALQVVVDNGYLQAGNPAPVADALDPAYRSGRIFLFYNTGTASESETANGHGLRECFYITTEDAGRNWSAPVNITTQVHRPKAPAINPQYNFPEDWRTYANTPGHALQIIEGPFKGRIYVAANHSAGDPLPAAGHYRSHGYYTDDHGKTFHISAPLPVPGSNEATVAYLSQGGLLLNARNQRGDLKCRITARSSNGGANWDTVYYDRQLPDPVCQGSLLNTGSHKGKPILAFCNAADSLQRNHLTLRISFDEGISWPVGILADQGPGPDHTAYSDLVQTGKKSIGILYERDGYREIVYRQLKW